MAATELSPRDAARMVSEAHAWDDALARRSEGAIWMLWGIVVPAMFVSYGYAYAAHAPDWVYATLWMPWVAAGVLVSAAFARVVRTRPRAADTRPHDRRVLWGVAVVALLFTLASIVLKPTTATVALAINGAIWTVGGAANVLRFTREGRTMATTTGAGCLVVAIALWVTSPSDDVQGLVATVTTAVLTLGTGLVRTLKG